MENNTKAMREALVPWISLGEWLIQNAGKDALGQGISEIVSKLRARVDASRAAISAPPRNCDVGTAEEQAKRFKGFCGQFDCYECPLGVGAGKVYYCALKWAQMPYAEEEGGAAQ